jgi:hypothetical protein
MIEIQNENLFFSFPEVHADARLSISFQRTLRIPDDNREHPLPASLGEFPLQHVDDYAKTVPANWVDHGGIFLPMYQSEAMWINFDGGNYPFAVKIAAGKIDAVTGEHWAEGLSTEQNYIVVPEQPWLDGYSIGEGLIRQFVAQPLGEGFTAEEQIDGKAEHGGLQIQVFPMKRDLYEKMMSERSSQMNTVLSLDASFELSSVACCSIEPSMGLAPGGMMSQEIYDDEHGLSAWETSVTSRCFVHIANSEAYQSITGEAPPTTPIGQERYAESGIPWFDYYQADKKVHKGSSILAGLDSVATKMAKMGKPSTEPTFPVPPNDVIQLGDKPKQVREGDF